MPEERPAESDAAALLAPDGATAAEEGADTGVRRHTWLPLLHDSTFLYGIRTGVPVPEADKYASRYPWRLTKVSRARVAELVERGTLVRIAKLPTFQPRMPFEPALLLDYKVSAFAAYARDKSRDLKVLRANIDQLRKDLPRMQSWADAATPVAVTRVFQEDSPLLRLPAYTQGMDRTVDAWTRDGGNVHDLRALLLALEHTAGRDGGGLDAADFVGRMSPHMPSLQPRHVSTPLYDSTMRFVQKLPGKRASPVRSLLAVPQRARMAVKKETEEEGAEEEDEETKKLTLPLAHSLATQMRAFLREQQSASTSALSKAMAFVHGRLVELGQADDADAPPDEYTWPPMTDYSDWLAAFRSDGASHDASHDASDDPLRDITTEFESAVFERHPDLQSKVKDSTVSIQKTMQRLLQAKLRQKRDEIFKATPGIFKVSAAEVKLALEDCIEDWEYPNVKNPTMLTITKEQLREAFQVFQDGHKSDYPDIVVP